MWRMEKEGDEWIQGFMPPHPPGANDESGSTSLVDPNGLVFFRATGHYLPPCCALFTSGFVVSLEKTDSFKS